LYLDQASGCDGRRPAVWAAGLRNGSALPGLSRCPRPGWIRTVDDRQSYREQVRGADRHDTIHWTARANPRKRIAMSRHARLDAFKADFEAGKPPYGVPRSAIDTMHRATAELFASGAAAHTKKVGDKAPEFALGNSDGDIVRSTELLKKGPLIVSFHPGAWCPYYDVALRAIDVPKPELEKHGASLVAISPQTPPNSRKSARRNKLTFPILSDTEGEVAASFGLRFRLPDHLMELNELIELYKWLRNDVPAVNRDSNSTLLGPARYVIGADATILYADVNPDYRRRPQPEDLIPALEQAAAIAA